MYHYEYLLYSLIFTSIFGAIVYWRKDLRAHLLLPCLLGAIAGPVSELLYFKDYWRPWTLLGVGIPGIEDVLFGAAIVGLTLVAYPLLMRRREHYGHRNLRLAIPYAVFSAVSLGLLIGFTGINSVIATSLICLIMLIPIFVKRSALVWPSLFSGLAIAVVAGTVYVIGLSFWFPGTLQHIWLLYGTSQGITIFKVVPLTELIWFFCTGSFIKAFSLYISSVQYKD